MTTPITRPGFLWHACKPGCGRRWYLIKCPAQAAGSTVTTRIAAPDVILTTRFQNLSNIAGLQNIHEPAPPREQADEGEGTQMTRLIFLPDDDSPIILYESALKPEELLEAAAAQTSQGSPEAALTILRQGNFILAAPQTRQGPQLSQRQQQVLTALAAGLTTRQIAYRLQITPRMVTFHISALKVRLNAQSRPEIIRRAMEWGLLAGHFPK